MRILYRYGWIFLMAALTTACMKDKGNYTYRQVNRITISGVDTEYYFNLNRPAVIRPVLSFSQDPAGDTGRYKYTWLLDRASGFLLPTDTLGSAHDLNIIMNPAFGCATYFGYYRVTDTVTGLFSQQNFTMHVVTDAYEGWLLLCDPEDGSSRLDMISQRGDHDSLYVDVLKKVGSTFPMTAPPAFVASGPLYLMNLNGFATPVIATTKSAAVLGLDTLNYSPARNLNSFVSGQSIADFTGADVTLKLSGGALYAANNIYSLYSDGTISAPVNHLDGAPATFNAARLMASDNYGDIFMLYDMDTHQLVSYYSGDPSCQSLTPGNLFDYSIDNNTPGGMDLVYMEGTTFNNKEVFCVLRAKTTGKYYLARCSFDGAVQSFYGEITGTDIRKASLFAVSPDYGYLFYNVGGKVYEYDMNLQQSFLMKDYGERTITVLKFNFLNFSDITRWALLPANYARYSALRRKLLVATYQQGSPTSSGALDIYTVTSTNRPLSLYKTYSGTGKIVSIGFRER